MISFTAWNKVVASKLGARLITNFLVPRAKWNSEFLPNFPQKAVS